MDGKQHQSSPEEQSENEIQQTQYQPADVTYGTVKNSPYTGKNPSTTESRKNVNGDPNLIQGNELNEQDNMDQLNDSAKTDGCPAHPGKLNHTENDRTNPIDGKNAQ